MSRFAISTNVSRADGNRITHTVPSWLQTFGDAIEELVIVVDNTPPTGRIAALHRNVASVELLAEKLLELKQLDRRIRIAYVPSSDELAEMFGRWFKAGRPTRCQAGTPIAAFIFAMDQCRSDIVMRTDCDMVFCDRGFVRESACLLRKGDADLIEPPRFGDAIDPNMEVSTRALLFAPRSLHDGCLPMVAHRLDLLRRIHRRIRRRPTYLPLEQMFTREVRSKRMRHRVLPTTLGHSVHMGRQHDFELPHVKDYISRIEKGDVPAAQRDNGWNFSASAWGAVSD